MLLLLSLVQVLFLLLFTITCSKEEGEAETAKSTCDKEEADLLSEKAG